MMIFPIDRGLALKAFKLRKAGNKGKATSLVLGKGITTDEANLLGAAGASFDREEACALSKREKDILLALAAIVREDRLRGETSSPKAKRIAWRLRLSEGQVRRATKRLNPTSYYVHGEIRLGLLEHSANGHIWLTNAGWSLVHALEEAAAIALIMRDWCISERSMTDPNVSHPLLEQAEAILARIDGEG